MSVYLVTWNLNNEKPNYADARKVFLSKLEEYDNIKDSGLDSVRFISTNQSAQQISDNLRQAMDDDDRIFVTKLNVGGHQGWLDISVWKWIETHI
jgi:hypothetical protein